MGHLDQHLTGIILGYHRPQNIPPIIASLRTQGLDNVILFDNSHDGRCIKAVSDDCWSGVKKVSLEGMNWICFGRFIAAADAPTEHIYVQDDDSLPCDVSQLLHWCTRHRKLVTYLDDSHMQWSQQHYKLENCNAESWETLLGWGAVFEKAWLAVFVRYIAFFREADETLFREADRIFTLLLCQPHIELKADIKHMDGAKRARIALSVNGAQGIWTGGTETVQATPE